MVTFGGLLLQDLHVIRLLSGEKLLLIFGSHFWKFPVPHDHLTILSKGMFHVLSATPKRWHVLAWGVQIFSSTKPPKFESLGFFFKDAPKI